MKKCKNPRRRKSTRARIAKSGVGRRRPAVSPKRARAAARRRRRNPGEMDDAAKIFEQFHGKPATRVKEVTELEHSRTTLADLGQLISLTVWLDEDKPYELNFKGVRLAVSPDGGQLYFVGNQALNLAAAGLDRYLPKDHIAVGPVSSIVYYTSKAFHDFEPMEYEHEFGEEGGEEPVLGYDVQSQKFYLTGGSYQVRPEGIVN